MQRVPTLVGVGGHFKGERYALRYGRTVTIGRSREADFSLKRTDTYRNQSNDDHDKDVAAKTVSGKHLQVTMYNLRSIEIKNLSPNGTQVDGKVIETIVINDVADKPHEIRFGNEEVLRLEMREHADIQQLQLQL
jgi:pSer/pThr/pTyr-binding forkhead associated (FHA) protein